MQGGFGYSLYLVQQYGAERRRTQFYAECFQHAFPPLIDDFRGSTYSTPEKQSADAYSVRVLTRFMARFGLADIQTEGDSIFDQETYVTSTPLLNRLVGWKPIVPPDIEVLPPEPSEGPDRSEASVLKLPQIADPTIDEALEQFLEAQRASLRPRTVAKYESVIDLLRSHLNGYAYEALSDAESALFDQYFNAEGEDHREFCQIFGPGMIIENLSGFLGYFMVRKVMGSGELKKAAGTVTRKLCGWLRETGVVEEESAEIAEAMASEAGRDLPRAEEAAQILFEAAEELYVAPAELDDKDYVEFSHHTIAKVSTGELWLEVYEGPGPWKIGPIPVPKEATDLLQEGWDISCALGRIRGTWQIVEVANVYPS